MAPPTQAYSPNSQKVDSPNLRRSKAIAAFLLRDRFASASDLSAHEPQRPYSFVSFVPYAPHELLVRRGAPVPAPISFQPLIHAEDTAQHCFCPSLQFKKCRVSLTQQRIPVAYLARMLALSFSS